MTSFASTAELRAYLPQVPELGIQLITISGASGGTFTLSYEGVASSALAWNASATTVQTALRAIPAIGTAGVNVRGRPGGPYTAAFQGTLLADAGPLTGDVTLLTPPGAAIACEPATDEVLQDCLDRATDIVRGALRSLLADPAFDYAAYGVASTAIVRGADSTYLRLPAYQLSSVTFVEYQSSSNPSGYTALTASEWEAGADGRLYRASGWYSGVDSRYRVTAVWGYGPTPPAAVAEVTIEQAVNIWRSRDKGGFSEVVGVDGSGAVKQVAGLNKLQMQVLTNLRDELITIGV